VVRTFAPVSDDDNGQRGDDTVLHWLNSEHALQVAGELLGLINDDRIPDQLLEVAATIAVSSMTKYKMLLPPRLVASAAITGLSLGRQAAGELIRRRLDNETP
jgi:hypothetical protein